MLVITEEQVEAALPLADALRAVEEALTAPPETIDALSRRRLHLGPTRLNIVGAAAADRLAVKAYTRSDQSAVLLFAGDGAFLAVIEGKVLSRLRTAAATGVATKWLSRADSARAAIIGTGWQAAGQLQAVCAVRPITSAAVWSPTEDHREDFARRMSAALQIPVTATSEAAEAVADADVVVTATKSAMPVLHGDWLAAGVHVNLVGANLAHHCEGDEAVLQRSDVVVVDDIEQATREAGEILAAVAAGRLQWSDVRVLGDIAAGREQGRTEEGQVTVFKSLGIGLEDVAVAALVYERVAGTDGRGRAV